MLFQERVKRTQDAKSVQWETVLQSPIDRHDHIPLQQWLTEASANGRGTIIAYDRFLTIYITLQPDAGRATASVNEPFQHTKLGKIEISVDYESLINDVYDHEWELVPENTQIWLAWVHWAEICCRMVNPLYGCGYVLLDTKIEEFPFEGTETQYIELPLLDQRLPKTEQIFATTLLQYLGPPFVEREEAKALMLQHTIWTHYLPTGGALLVLRPEERFSYGHGLAYDFHKLAVTIDEHDEKKGDLFHAYGNMILQQTWDDMEE